MEAVEWLAPFKRHTERLREHVEHRTLEETVAYAAQETNLSWDTVKEIDKARLRRLYEHFHWDNSRRLAVDEFAIHREHRYATVVYSIDTKKVLWLDRGRSRATLRKFFNLLTPEQRKLFKNPRAKPDGTKMFCSAFLNDARMCCFFADAIVKY